MRFACGLHCKARGDCKLFAGAKSWVEWVCRIYLPGSRAPPHFFRLPPGGWVPQEVAMRLRNLRPCPGSLMAQPSSRSAAGDRLLPPLLSLLRGLSALSQHCHCNPLSLCRKPRNKRNKLFILLRSLTCLPSLPWHHCRRSLS